MSVHNDNMYQYISLPIICILSFFFAITVLSGAQYGTNIAIGSFGFWIFIRFYFLYIAP